MTIQSDYMHIGYQIKWMTKQNRLLITVNIKAGRAITIVAFHTYTYVHTGLFISVCQLHSSYSYGDYNCLVANTLENAGNYSVKKQIKAKTIFNKRNQKQHDF